MLSIDTRRAALLTVVLPAFALLAGTAAMAADLPASNPFASVSTLPFEAPPFDKIKDGDYKPAIEAGMAQELTEFQKIANDPEAPTFDNTITAMERSGDLLARVQAVFQNLTGSNTDPALDKLNEEEAPRLQAHADQIHLDAKLFKRVKTLYDQRDTLKLDPAQKFLLERTYIHFQRAGAELSAADQKTLKDLNKQIAALSATYLTKLQAAANAAAPIVTDKAKLAGATESEINSFEVAAKGRKLDGKYVIPLQNTTQQPVLADLADRDLRQQILEASEMRGDKAGPDDLRDIIATLAQLRAKKAKLFGYPSFAAYVMADQMAKTPEEAKKLLLDLVPSAIAKAKSEAADIQAAIDQQKGGFKLTAADWEFYSEQVRKAKYALDASEVRQYFQLDRVLQDGVFFAANKLYGLTFKERHDLPVYQPDVRVFEVFDADGKWLALFYADYFKRPNKNGGAWCNFMNQPSGLENRKPIIVNVANFTKPAAGQPALLDFDDVTTMFHEFGHALHAMFSVKYYPDENGFNLPTRCDRVSVAIQRALGARSDRARELRQALSDRCANAGRPGRQDQEGSHLWPGLCADGDSRRLTARSGMAQPAGRCAEAGAGYV